MNCSPPHSPSVRRRAAIVALAMVLGLLPGGAEALAADAVVLRTCLVLTRAVAYDANLRTRASNKSIVIGVLRKRGASSDGWLDTLSGMTNVRMQGIPLRVQSIVLGSPAEVEAALVKGGVGVLFATPDIAAADIEALRTVVKRRNLLTVGTTREQVQRGVTLAVVPDAGKLSLMLNARIGREQGAAFSDELFRIAVAVH